MIYQLAKTSVGLTGQVKWDMVVDNGFVHDLQIVPIHEDVDFNHTEREDTFNYTHIQNLNRLYKKTQGQFFEPVVDRRLNTGYPVRTEEYKEDTYEHSYDMGMKRNKSYQRYNKQFSFFCPIYCTDKNEIKNLKFYAVVVHEDPNKNPVVLCQKEINTDKIKDYLYQYVDEVDLNSDIIYLNFKEFNSWIKGVNVRDAKVEVKNQLGLIETLLQQERPMLEFDNMLLRQLSDNYLIATQVFNFNFNFNIEDLIYPTLIHELQYEKLNVYVLCYVDGEEVELVDMYSNYKEISMYDIQNKNYVANNCLDYLHDYVAIDLLSHNKLVQSTFHWALQDNPKYLFNMYDGCAPLYNGSQMRGMYFDQPDLTTSQYDPAKNSVSWLNVRVMKPGKTAPEIAQLCLDEWRDKNNYLNFYSKDDIFWLNNIKVNNIEGGCNIQVKVLYFSEAVVSDEGDELTESLKAMFDNVSNSGRLWVVNSYGGTTQLFVAINQKPGSYIDDTQVFSQFMPGKWSELPKASPDIEDYSKVDELLNNIIQPQVLTLNNILKTEKVNGPYIDLDTSEIEYFKEDGFVYLLRYDGKIQPFFLTKDQGSLNNREYRVKQYVKSIDNSDDNMEKFNQYMYTKYSPLYPSVKYFSLIDNDLDYNKMDLDGINETSWYRNSKMYFIPSDFEVITEKHKGSLTDEVLYDEFKKHFPEGMPINYLYKLYEVTYKYDYKNNTDIETFVYDIKYRLK